MLASKKDTQGIFRRLSSVFKCPTKFFLVLLCRVTSKGFQKFQNK